MGMHRERMAIWLMMCNSSQQQLSVLSDRAVRAAGSGGNRKYQGNNITHRDRLTTLATLSSDTMDYTHTDTHTHTRTSVRRFYDYIVYRQCLTAIVDVDDIVISQTMV